MAYICISFMACLYFKDVFAFIHPPLSLINLTHWDRDKMAAISQTTFQDGFSWMKMHEFWFKFRSSFFLGSINNTPSLVQIMAWRRPGAKPLSESMMVSFLTHICNTRPQWIKICFFFRSIIELSRVCFELIQLVCKWHIDFLKGINSKE